MLYSGEPKDRIYLKGYGILSFAKNFGTHATKVAKNLSGKYSQKLLNRAKKSTTDAINTASNRAVKKTAEATGDLTGNKIADKIKSAPKKWQSKTYKNEIEIPKERYISPEERLQIIDDLRLV